MINKVFILFFLTLITSGCIEKIRHHGHSIDNEVLKSFKNNITTKEDILAVIGSPSSKSLFGNEEWYYVKTVKTSTAFIPFAPKERETYVFKFDNNDKLVEIKSLTLKDGAKIELNSDKTIYHGTTENLLDSFINNIGRFNDMSGNKKLPERPKGIR
jgi:outer membrane protein assembly factor BamE (lipoprotein component of BamABCDE complex)